MSASSRDPAADVRPATADDGRTLAVLLDAFNREYGDYTPGVEALAVRLAQLLGTGEAVGLLAEAAGGREPLGFAVMRFRPALLLDAPEAYLQELYVVPGHRGRGIGRRLLDAAIGLARDRDAAWIELGTSEDDTAARALYESAGFIDREGGPEGPVMVIYELDLRTRP